MSTIRLLASVSLLVLLSGCGKSDPGSLNEPGTGGGTKQPGGPSAVEITTQSSVHMVYVLAGEFLMGSDQGNPDEAPAHKGKVSTFLMDQFEVTQELFAKAQLPN